MAGSAFLVNPAAIIFYQRAALFGTAHETEFP